MDGKTKALIFAAGRRLRTYFKTRLSRSLVQCGSDVHVGARTRFWAPRFISIGNHVYVGKDVHIEANCTIGDFCLIANRVAIIGRADHDHTAVGYPIRYAPWIGSRIGQNDYGKSANNKSSSVVIEDDVWIGFGAMILTGVRIGRGSIVAAGSVVTRDVAAYSIVAGNPARKVKSRFPDADAIFRHEYAIKNGEFQLSELGLDFCKVAPKL